MKAGDARIAPFWRRSKRRLVTQSYAQPAEQSRSTGTRFGQGIAGSDAGKPWRRCHGEWLVAGGGTRTVTRSSSSKTAVGVSTEGSQQCKRSILQRVLGAQDRDPIAAGDGSKADREAVSQKKVHQKRR